MMSLRTCLALLSTFCAAAVGTAAMAADTLPPTLTKEFAAPAIAVGETTLMTITVTNPNPAFQLSGITFDDTLPAGLAMQHLGDTTNSCLGTFNQGSDGLALSNAVLAGNASCTISVRVTGIAPGLQVNTTSAVSSDQVIGGSSASATILVFATTGVPALQAWALGALALLLALAAARALACAPARRR